MNKISSFIIEVTSLEDDNIIVSYNLGAADIWPDKRDTFVVLLW